MPIDNDVYDRLGGSWWDESSPLNLLHGTTPAGSPTSVTCSRGMRTHGVRHKGQPIDNAHKTSRMKQAVGVRRASVSGWTYFRWSSCCPLPRRVK
jgi:hypothetical protein